MSATPYRPDIDGLRAVAVLAVVVYHAWPSALPGGFVGVDIFFVISGYLITRILVAPGVSLWDFYCRRVRRIFPALLIVLASTLAIGATFLPPDHFRNLLAHAVGGGLFAANFVAFQDVGYFNGAAELKPLVHLWSLGVEEQFYLAWPALVLFASRHGKLPRLIAIGGLLSFALFAWLSEADPRAAFYFSPPRFWELLAGALLVGVTVPERRAVTASACGLGLIAASLWFIRSQTEFPGALLAVPTLGACLVIASPHARGPARLLSAKAMVAIGLISYPLYLWHWPLLSLLRNYNRAPSQLALASVVLLSLLLAALTWRAVEKPLVRLNLRRVAAASAVGMVATVGLSGATYATHPAESQEIANAECLARYSYRNPELWFCRLSKNAEPTVLVLGDSHANHLYDGLVELLPTDAVLAIGACMPTLGLVYPERADARGACANDNFEVQSEFLQRQVIGAPSLRWVVLSAMWRTFDDAGHEIDAWSGKATSTFSPVVGSALETYVAALERQIERLGPRPVTIVLDTPRRGIALEVQRQRHAPFNAKVREMAKRHDNVRVFDPVSVLCGAAWCAWDQLRDANHLSRKGSVTIAQALTVPATAFRSVP